MDFIQITKIALQPKIELVKKEKLNGPKKIEPKQPKNYLSRTQSRNYMPFAQSFLFQLRITIRLKQWNSDFPSLKTICGLPQKTYGR